jgi:hypothetical protein
VILSGRSFRTASQAAGVAGAEDFLTREVAKLAAAWPGSRLVEIWNGLPGVAPVKKFTDRKTAVARIWRAAQALTPPLAPQGAPDAPKGKESRKKATRRQKAAPAQKGGTQAREGSKKAEVLELLRRSKGATLDEISMHSRGPSPTRRLEDGPERLSPTLDSELPNEPKFDRFRHFRHCFAAPLPGTAKTNPPNPTGDSVQICTEFRRIPALPLAPQLLRMRVRTDREGQCCDP